MKISVQITRGIEPLFGTRDENIRVLESGLHVSTSLLNDSLEIEGDEPNVIRAASILEEPITADIADERGPDSVKTKAEILTYLKESFVSLKRAASTIDDKNAFSPIKGVFGSRPDTRLGLIAGAISHSSNHYGQIVEYLRMNGLIPPGSQ